MKLVMVALLALFAGALLPSSGDSDAWADWWRLNRRAYFAPTPFKAAASGAEAAAPDPRALEWHASALAVATGALKSSEAGLRRAGAITLGRLSEPLCATLLLPLLDDGDPTVRRAALLAMGTCASEGARKQLLDFVGGENRTTDTATDVGTAFVALALCRMGVADDKIDAALEAKLDPTKKIAREVEAGALLHQKLARNARLWPATRAIAVSEQVATDVRALAIEALAFSPTLEDYDFLVGMLRSKEVEFRRSAALGFGVAREPRAVSALLAAIDDEKNSAARGFMILSLGKLATEDGVAKLLLERQRPGALDRAWAALALGLAARAGNGKARAALDLPLETKLQPVEHGASLLAIGLARQAGASDFLEAAASAKSEVDLGPFVANGLALMATSSAHACLVARLVDDPVEANRVLLGDGLARMRIEADAPALIEHSRRISAPERRREAIESLGRHGSAMAIESLLNLAMDESKNGADRAAALEAVSIALSKRPLDRLSALAVNSNFFTLEDWILEIARSGL